MVKQCGSENIVTLEESLSRFAVWRSKPARARRIPDEPLGKAHALSACSQDPAVSAGQGIHGLICEVA